MVLGALGEISVGCGVKMIKRVGSLVGTLLVLGACSQTQLLVHTAKRISGPDAQSKGSYKIGKPYQIKGIWYYPKVNYQHIETGIASWYGPGFHGKKTANGEIYNQNNLTAAHRTLPMPSLVQVTNLENGRSLRLTVNDRGPFAHGRVIDVSRRAAQLLGFHRRGTARVRVAILASESRLLARRARNGNTLARTGSPIQRNTKLPKATVASQGLAPPPGGQAARVSAAVSDSRAAIRRSAPRERLTPEAALPDGTVTTVAVGSSDMYVQVGAYTQFQNAHQAAARLGNLQTVTVSSKILDGREFFRVRAGPFNNLKAADNLLETILRLGFSDARITID